MTTKSTKPVLLVLIGMAIGACGAALRPALPASATSTKVCDYTRILDSGMGEEGAIEYNDEWRKVLDAGWRLHSANMREYIFEKCR
jgi:hypothetical protein